MRKKRGRPKYDDVLTPAEWRTVHAVRHGMTNREIASKSGTSIDAVKYHVANILAKLRYPGRRALRRWFAVPKGSALDRQEKDVASPVTIGPIGQVSRTASDIGAAVKWYGDVLGLPHLYTFGNLAFFDCGGTRLFLSQEDEPSPTESILYLSVDDIEAAYQQLEARGVEFLQTPHLVHRHDDGTEEWMAFFNDPDGRPLAIMSRVRD